MCAGKGYVAPSGLSNRDIKLFAVRGWRDISAQSRRGGPCLFPEKAITLSEQALGKLTTPRLRVIYGDTFPLLRDVLVDARRVGD